MDVNDRSYSNVWRIYEIVEPALYLPGKNGSQCTQNRWKTIVRKQCSQRANEKKQAQQQN